MGEPKVTETRESYHDIGICVTVFDNKVVELLRKIVAHKLSYDYSTLFEQLQQISSYSNRINSVSFKILEHVIKQQHSFTQCWRSIRYSTDYRNIFHTAFEEMIHKFNTTWRVLKDVKLTKRTNEILLFLPRNLNAHQNFVKVLIEHFLLDVQCNATVLNDLLGRLNVGSDWKLNIIYPCLDENGTLIRPRHNFCNDTVGCKYRYRRREADKGPWDWVNEMKYIRNDVVHSDFKFEDNQNEQNFLRKYRRFIDAIDFAVLFPLNGDDAEREYTDIIKAHDVVKGEIGKLQVEVGRLKGEVGRWKGEVGRWQDEVERLSEENSEWRIENYEKEHDHIEHLRNLMTQMTASDKWEPAKKRDGKF